MMPQGRRYIFKTEYEGEKAFFILLKKKKKKTKRKNIKEFIKIKPEIDFKSSI